MAEHGWSVRTIVDGTPMASIMRYRASCTCGAPFGLRCDEGDAALDALDHIRIVEGRPTRRQEIEEERAAKAAAKVSVSPLRRR